MTRKDQDAPAPEPEKTATDAGEGTTPPPDPEAAPEATDGASAPESAASEPEAEPTSADYQEAKSQTTDADVAADHERGFHGTIADPVDGDLNAVKTADEAAPDEVASENGGSYFGMLPEHKDAESKAVPLNDLPPQPRNLRQTEDQRKGYFGEPPTSDAERKAMTLPEQAKAAAEQYGDGRNA